VAKQVERQVHQARRARDVGKLAALDRAVAATAGGAPAPALLIRPDGYVAWAGAEPGSLTAALTRWFSPG
jgi:hypothetical protein